MGAEIGGARRRIAGHDRDRGLRRVVPVFHAGGLGPFAVGQLRNDGFVDRDLAEHFLQRLERQSAWTEQARRRDREVDDRGLDADRTGSSVEYAVDLAVHVLAHVGEAGRAGAAGGVAGRGRDGHVGCADDGERDGMVRAADADGVEAAGRAERDDGLARQDHRQRARPEAFGEAMGALGNVFAVALEPRGIRDVDDERVVLWTALGLEDVQDGLFVEGVGPESIDRLGRDAEQAAAADDVRCRGDVFRCRFGEIDRVHMEFLLNLRDGFQFSVFARR